MRDNSKSRPKRPYPNSGFTLMEAMIAVLLLTVIVGAIFSQINKAQKNIRVESQKLDLTQQQGEFLDQFTRDLHQAGFPTLKSVGGNPALAAAGLTAISATSLTMEGDLDGTGVQTVTYSWCDGVAIACPANVTCPCLLRSAVPKGKPAAPFVAVQNVIAGSYAAYNSSGAPVSLNPPVALNSIRSVRVTFTLAGGQDANGVTQIQTTMTGMARLPNN
jgi:type II secretory pathway pseudopilin PulG